MLRCQGQSTVRQYQSAWKVFQEFVAIRKPSSISSNFILQFASYLFHCKDLSSASISSYMAAVADPLFNAYGVKVDNHSLDLLKRFLPAASSETFSSTYMVIGEGIGSPFV